MILEHESTSAHHYVLLRAHTHISSTEVSMVTARQPRLTKSFKAFKQLSENALCITSDVKLRKLQEYYFYFSVGSESETSFINQFAVFEM